MIIVQNKLDLVKDNENKQNFMESTFLEEFAKKNGFDCFFQTSAKTGENVNLAISSFLKIVIEKYENYFKSRNFMFDDDAVTENVNLKEPNLKESKKCCQVKFCENIYKIKNFK